MKKFLTILSVYIMALIFGYTLARWFIWIIFCKMGELT